MKTFFLERPDIMNRSGDCIEIFECVPQKVREIANFSDFMQFKQAFW